MNKVRILRLFLVVGLLFHLNVAYSQDQTVSGNLTVTGSTVSKTIQQVRYADQFCSSPGTYNESCINSAIQDLPTAGGTVALGDHTYTISSSIVMHRGVNLVGVSRRETVIQGNGLAAFTSSTGMIRFCDNASCSHTPVTTGEQDMRLAHIDVRIAQAGDVGINAYGMAESLVEDVVVESQTAGQGTGIIVHGDSVMSFTVSDYSNTFNHFFTRNLDVGIQLGNAADATQGANANVFNGGMIQAHQPLIISSGTGNAFFGTRFVGGGLGGEVLWSETGGASTARNACYSCYMEEAFQTHSPAYTAVAFSISSGSVANRLYPSNIDFSNGTLTAISDSGTSTVYQY